MTAEERQQIETDGVFAGSIRDGSTAQRAALHTTERIDETSETVVETTRSVSTPTLALKVEIRDKRYRRIRAYIIGLRRTLLKAEQYRQSYRAPNWKPKGRKPKRMSTSLTCPDCDGSGYAKNGDCPRCNGDGWITAP